MARRLNDSGGFFGTIYKCLFYLTILISYTSGLTAASSRYKHYHRTPIIDLNGAEELVGIIRENERVVSISPQLRILRDTGPICRYELNQISENSANIKDDLPFESRILDKTDGTAQIRLKNGASIDCSNNKFIIQVVAVRCADDSARSEIVTLKITVKDTNNHIPEFEAPWYSFDVDEGKTGEIARIYASDGDCGHPYGKICRYEITNALDGNPFQIDDQGILTTVKPLNASYGESHILTIVAHDCGMLSSKSTLVTIHVRPKCVNGLMTTKNSNIGNVITKPDSIVNVEASGLSAARRLMPNVSVRLCLKEQTCTVKYAESKILLYQLPTYVNINTDSLKLCAFQHENIELLPEQNATVLKPTTLTDNDLDDEDIDEDEEEDDEDAKIDKSENSDNSEEENEKKYYFNGKSNSIIVSRNKIKSVIPQNFTLTFAMKHKPGTKEQQSVKQNILCETDDFAMNRHHFAVYLRHCKLELLLRREAKNSVAEFRAAEWRWQAAEMCDDKWHSYAIVFIDLDNVKLYIDGKLFDTTDRDPEILDDWPLHETKQHKTRLVVGACWHGRQQTMVQYFTGYLAKMFIAMGKIESENSIECLHSQHGSLNFDAINRLVVGESVIFDKSQFELTVKANNLKSLASLLQNIEFKIDANAPKNQNKRHFIVNSHVDCVEENRTIMLGTYKADINVIKKAPEQRQLPQLLISGQTLIKVERQALKSGTSMLPNIQIVVTQPNTDDATETDVTSQHRLDWCKVHLKPSRDMDLEYFSSPAALISFLNVDFEHDKQGIMLKGKESVKNYEDVLAKIRYYNTRAESYNKRLYTVQCAMLGEKIFSNDFFVQMNIVDDNDIEETVEKLSSLSKKLNDNNKNPDEPSSTAIEDQEILKLEKHFEPSFDRLGANRLQNILEMDLPRPKALLGSHHGYDMSQGSVAGGAVAIVVIVCIGFLLVLLVIGVLKMRESPLPRRSRRNRKATIEGMEWDDNGMNMNITVNPLMDLNKAQSLETASAYGSDGEESLDDEESYHEEDELTDDGEENEGADRVGILPHAESNKRSLEWDDSTLSPLASSSTNSNGVLLNNNNNTKSYCV